MKVINLTQPQATLLSLGLIKFVSGNWIDRDYRGPVYICSNGRDSVTAAHPLVRNQFKGLDINPEELPSHAIVGEGRIQDCIDNNSFPDCPSDLEFVCNRNIPGGESCLDVVETRIRETPIEVAVGAEQFWEFEETPLNPPAPDIPLEHTGFEEARPVEMETPSFAGSVETVKRKRFSRKSTKGVKDGDVG